MERLETQAVMWPKALAGVGAVYRLLRLEARKGGAGDGDRTRYLNLGKVALCQMSYSR